LIRPAGFALGPGSLAFPFAKDCSFGSRSLLCFFFADSKLGPAIPPFKNRAEFGFSPRHVVRAAPKIVLAACVWC
jgi:hypothetical protein